MIVDKMSLLEVAAELLGDFKNEVIARMERKLGDNKYRRYVLKFGKCGKTIYFKPFNITTKRLNKFIILPFCHGKSDYKKFGMAFAVMLMFYRKGYPYVAWITDDGSSVIFFQKHFFERYNERFVQGDVDYSESFILDFLKRNMLVYMGSQYEDGSNNVMGVSTDGVLLGEKLSPSVTKYNTYISIDMLKGSQIEQHRQMYEKLLDYIRELKKVGLAA